MANIAKTFTFVNSQPADATQVNTNFDDIIAGVGDTADLHPTLATLGTAAYSEGTWTPILSSFTVVGTAPAVAGIYRRIGNLVFVEMTIGAGDGGNTSVASVGGTSNITGFPFNSIFMDITLITTDLSSENIGISRAPYVANFSAKSEQINIIGTYAV